MRSMILKTSCRFKALKRFIKYNRCGFLTIFLLPHTDFDINMQTKRTKCRESEVCCPCISMGTVLLPRKQGLIFIHLLRNRIPNLQSTVLWTQFLVYLDLYVSICSCLLTSRHSCVVIACMIAYTRLQSYVVVCTRIQSPPHSSVVLDLIRKHV